MNTGCSMIPIKCRCGEVLASVYRTFKQNVRERRLTMSGEDIEKVHYLTKENTEKTIEGQLMDEYGITKHCCRLILLTHQDI